MKAEDVLPDAVNHTEVAGLAIRKGTVAAFLANARIWSSPEASASERQGAERDMLEALPALHALGLFQILEVRDRRLRSFLESR